MPRRYMISVQKIEICLVEVDAANVREARKKARDPNNWVENHGWDGMTSWFGKVLSVERLPAMPLDEMQTRPESDGGQHG